MAKPIIEVENLSKRYRLGRIGATTLRDDLNRMWQSLRGPATPENSSDFWALRDVSFTVQPGEVLGVIGRNGAGKSTLLKLLSRITEPTAGRITLRGRVASLLEVGTGFHQDLTGRENVFLNGAILGMKRSEIAARFDEIVDFAEVEKFIDTPVKHYSSGMRVRLAFAVAAHLDSEILIVDEVLAVGDARFQERCRQKMTATRNSRGTTILLVSHQLPLVQSLCDRGIILQAGRLTHDATIDATLSAYVSALTAHAGSIELGRRTDRGGDGRVRVEKLDLIGEGESVVEWVPSGSALKIVATLNKPTRPPGFVCAFYDSAGTLVADFDSSLPSAQDRREDGPTSTIACHIPHLALRPGRYYLNIALLSGHTMLDHVEAAGVLEIRSGVNSGRPLLDTARGYAFPEHRWEFLSAK